MRRFFFSVPVILALFILAACSDAGTTVTDTGPNATGNFMDTASSLFRAIEEVLEYEDPTAGSYPAGMSVAWVVENDSVTVTFSSCQVLAAYNVILTGTLSIAQNPAPDSGTLVFTGTMTTADSVDVLIDASVTFPTWPDGEPDVDENPLSVTGTLTVGDEVHNLADIIDYADTGDGDGSLVETVENPRFITVGDSEIMLTDDGTHWEIAWTVPGSTILYDVACGVDASSTGTMFAVGQDGTIYQSNNMRNWQEATVPSEVSPRPFGDPNAGDPRGIESVEHVNGQFYAGLVAYPGILASEDGGTTWVRQDIPGGYHPNYNNQTFYGFAYDGSRLIAAGSQMLYKDGTNAAELNAAAWTILKDSDAPEGETGFEFLLIRDIEFSDGYWVAVGQQLDSGTGQVTTTRVILTSSDGSDWDIDVLSSGDGWMKSVAADDSGNFVIAWHEGTEYSWNTPGHVLHSHDGGTTWNTGSLDDDWATTLSAAWNDMGNGTSRWAVAASTGEVYFSENGEEWTERGPDYGIKGIAPIDF